MSASAAVRANAARVVAGVAAHGRSLDAALALDQGATRQQRGLLRALCYDSIRWYLRLDALLDRLLAHPKRPSAPEVHALAIVGLCQLACTDIPAHAAVAETVNAARLLGQPRAAGLINAILRRFQREQAALCGRIDRDLATRTAHPRWLVDALAADWGDRSVEILDANNQRPPFWLRVNRRFCSGAQYRAWLEAAGIAVAASMFDDEALLPESALDVGDLPHFADGAVSVQDAAAQLGARLVAPRAGERILDACAAPGGKTGHLLELQPELAELVAVDVSPERLARVEENLRRLNPNAGPAAGSRSKAIGAIGAANLIAADAGEPSGWWDGRPFERILLDVPCSATGVIRRHPDIKLLRRAQDIPALAARQLHLLRSLWPLLAPGGRLVYASCSALHAEGAAVVEAFRASSPDARETTSAAMGALGLEIRGVEIPGLEIPGFETQGGASGHRIAAGTAAMDGFYYACLEKTKGR